MVVKSTSYDKWSNAGLCLLKDCPPSPSPASFLNYLSFSKVSQADQNVIWGQHMQAHTK